MDMITTIEELETASRATFLDGILTGEPFGNIVAAILVKATQYGNLESRQSSYFPATADYNDFGMLRREVTANAVNDLFGQTNFDQIIRSACMTGAAFGFQQGRLYDLFGEVELTMNAMLDEAKRNDGVVNDDTAEAFFGELLKLDDDHPQAVMRYLGQVLVGTYITFNASEVPSFLVIADRLNASG